MSLAEHTLLCCHHQSSQWRTVEAADVAGLLWPLHEILLRYLLNYWWMDKIFMFDYIYCISGKECTALEWDPVPSERSPSGNAQLCASGSIIIKTLFECPEYSFESSGLNRVIADKKLQGNAIDRMRQEGSRHRFRHKPPSTPPGFWKLGFGDSQDSPAE